MEAMRVVFEMADGSQLPVTIQPFQAGPGGPVGAGFYFTDGPGGKLLHGTVLRYDHGPDEEPRVIKWTSPRR